MQPAVAGHVWRVELCACHCCGGVLCVDTNAMNGKLVLMETPATGSKSGSLW
jgi:hypothetical protein